MLDLAREIIAVGVENREFIARSTTGFESYREAVEPYTLAYAERRISLELVDGFPVAATMLHERHRRWWSQQNRYYDKQKVIRWLQTLAQHLQERAISENVASSGKQQAMTQQLTINTHSL